jgi:hypothetical protein
MNVLLHELYKKWDNIIINTKQLSDKLDGVGQKSGEIYMRECYLSLIKEF